jgi:hypothetical protein
MQLAHRLARILAGCLGVAGGAAAQDDWTNTNQSFICRSSTEIREIKTYVADATPGDASAGFICRVDYVKNGTTQTIWSSHSAQAFCETKAADLAARLQAAGTFTCKPLHTGSLHTG